MDATGFGWQGFTLQHPSDWAPVSLIGNRSEGYVRLASSGRFSFHIRWKKTSSQGDLESRLKQYFTGLERDAKKRKDTFRKEFSTEEDHLVYKWQGASQGRGKLFFNAACSRVFFLELMAGRNDSVLPVFRSVADSFTSDVGELESWSLLGLELRLPTGLAVERKVFHAGKTHLALSGKGVKVVGERWGLAEQLLAKHELQHWACSVMEMKGAEASEEEDGLRLRLRSPLKGIVEALVRHDADSNQLTVLKTVSRSDAWRPQWEWLS